MTVSKASSCILRLFASLNIHYNKNTKVQKQNETKVKKLQTKVVDSVIFGNHCNTFFQQTSSFLKFLVKTSYDKTLLYKFHSTHLVLVIRIFFDKSLNYPKVYTRSKTSVQIKITSQVPNLLSMFKYNCIYQIEQAIYKFLLSIFLLYA